MTTNSKGIFMNGRGVWRIVTWLSASTRGMRGTGSVVTSLALGTSIARLLSVALLIGMILFVQPALAGSPFYLTVERGFSTTERAAVRLDFTSSGEPMVLRVLKPKDLDSFLTGQLNLSRAYEEPISELNPAHYIYRGLNTVEAPFAGARSLLSSDFRANFRGETEGKALQEPVSRALVSVPKEIGIAAPAGFEVVREVFVDLQKGGEIPDETEYEWSPYSENYQVRNIELEPLRDGIYLLQAVQGKIEAQALLQVSALAIQVKQAPQQLLVRVIDRQLTPVSGVTVSYRDGRGKWIEVPGRTDTAGQILFKNPEGMLDGKLLVKGTTSDGRQALTQTDFLPASSVENSVFVVTDRPIFKPGETFFFKGVLRLLDEGRLSIPKPSKPEAEVTLIRADGSATGQKINVPLTPFGSFSGSFDLNATQPPGLYRLVAAVDGKPYGGEFRVKDYIKPKFYLDLVDRDPIMKPGEKFSFRFKAKNFSGTIPQNVRYETFVYRKRFEAPEFVVESGSGLQAGSDYFGEVRSVTSLAQPQRIYSSVDARSGNTNGDIASGWETAPELDENGEAKVEIEIPKGTEQDAKIEWIYTVVVRAQDAAGSLAVLSESLYSTLSDIVASAKFRDPVSAVGASAATLVIRSTAPSGEPVSGAKGKVTVSLESASGTEELPTLTFATAAGGFGSVAIPLPKRPGRIRARATLEQFDGKPLSVPAQSEFAELLVGGSGGETVVNNHHLELFVPTTILSPGERTRMLALLPEHWGKNESGTLWQTAAGQSIFSTRGEQVNGRSRWLEIEAKPEYGTGFFTTVTVPIGDGKFTEQSVGFRVVPTDKRLSIAVHPSAEIAEPLKDFPITLEVKDSEGRPAAETELSVNVVDRAVYAVQPEFRPEILEFFYPLPRLNVGSFTSDELQGYGYADEIKKPNFRLTALKSRSRPAKKTMRDTAGWFPHVVTDRDGRATITVPMPANITEWIVTAIAADRNGRLGEGHGKFRSSSDLGADVTVPQFLHEGDEVQGYVQAENHLDRPVHVAMSSEGADALQVAAQGDTSPREVAAKGSARLPIQVTAPASPASPGKEKAGTLRIRLDADPGVRSGGADEFEVGVVPRTLVQRVSSGVVQGGNDIRFNVSPVAGIRAIHFQASPGMLGAAISAARNLVTYPYGCTEQLVHTTIPNLVLLDLLKKAEIPADRLGDFQLDGAVQDAKARAELGIQKLRMHQKEDGGFVLWGSETESSFPLTALVFRPLALANQLGIPGASAAYEKAYGYLASGSGDWAFRTGNALDGYTLALLAEARLLSAMQSQLISYVTTVSGDQNASIEDLVSALRIVRAVKGQWWLTPDMRVNENTEVLLTRLVGQLTAASDRSPVLRKVSADFAELGFAPGEVSIVAGALGVLKSFDRLPDALRMNGIQLLRTRMRDGIWYSTFETGEVILNMREFIQQEIEELKTATAEGRTIRILKSGSSSEPLVTLTPFPGGWSGSWEPTGTVGTLGALRIEGLRETDRAEAVLEAAVPFSVVAKQSAGIKVTRRLLRIGPKGSGELYRGEPLKIGDVVVSEVEVEREGLPRWDSPPSNFVIIEDGIPSVAQGVEEEGTYLADAGLASEEESGGPVIKDTMRYPERTVRVAQIGVGDRLKVHQVWRVAFTGHSVLAPARATDMYRASVGGNTVAEEIVVNQ